jgi:hypothetical protein
MKQPGLVNSALIFNTTYNWYSIYRKFNHPVPRLAEGLETLSSKSEQRTESYVEHNKRND